MKNGRRTLGRGLDALISSNVQVQTEGSSSISEIPLSEIQPNAEQPRTDFDPESLEELARSIRHIGIVQPITICELPQEEQDESGKRYKIISGERRYRAAKIAELSAIPAYIRTAEDEQIMEMALIENIQRKDLNAIEVSLAFKKLIEQYQLTQEDLSNRVGKNRATIANYLRLLALPAEIQMGIKDGKISMGHGRALLAIEEPELQLAFYEQILREGLSVRQVEQAVRDANAAITEPVTTPPQTTKQQPKHQNEDFALLSKRFSQLFETKVSMSCNTQGKGRITIPFKSPDQLEHILTLLDRL